MAARGAGWTKRKGGTGEGHIKWLSGKSWIQRNQWKLCVEEEEESGSAKQRVD